MDSSVYANKAFVTASKKWVNVYVSKDTAHGTEKVNGEERCKLHPSLRCEDHVGLDKAVGGKYFQGTIKTPASVWTDAEGKEIGKEQGAMSAKQLIEKMAEAEKKVGPGLGADEYVFAMERFAAAEKAVADSKDREALDHYAAVTKALEKVAPAKGIVERAKKGFDGVMDRVNLALAAAKELRAAGGKEAKERLTKLAKDFKGYPPGAEAAKELKEMEDEEKARKK